MPIKSEPEPTELLSRSFANLEPDAQGSYSNGGSRVT